MKNFTNEVVLEGKVQSHSLEVRTVANTESANYGKEYIAGKLYITTDDAGLNTVPITYRYVSPTFKSGKANSTFTNLKKIIDEWSEDKTMYVRATKVSGSLNEYYPNGSDELVSIQINEGGFCQVVTNLHDEKERNRFTFDVLINNVNVVEPEEEGAERYAEINCLIFNYAKEGLKYTLVAKDKAVIDFFEDLEVSPKEPVLTKVWGKIVNSVIKKQKTSENSFGEEAVDVSTRYIREWVITGGNATPYEFDSEETITRAELTKVLADRNVKLAEEKARRDERVANANAATVGETTEAPFKF